MTPREALALAEGVIRGWPGLTWTPNLDEDGVWDGTWSAPNLDSDEPRDISGSPDSDYAVEFSQLVPLLPQLAAWARFVAPIVEAAERWRDADALFDAGRGNEVVGGIARSEQVLADAVDEMRRLAPRNGGDSRSMAKIQR